MQPLTPFIDINYELAEYESQFDGINVIVTSELELSEEDILKSYHELYKIEEYFRVTKTELETRPVYVWTKEHIKAHFLSCFLALVLLRVLQYKINWELSVGRIYESDKVGFLPLPHFYMSFYHILHNPHTYTLPFHTGKQYASLLLQYRRLSRRILSFCSTLFTQSHQFFPIPIP